MSIGADILRDTVDHLSRCKLAKITKARSTGTQVILVDNRDGSYQQDGAPWYTLCLNHGLDCRHSTKSAAAAWMAAPEAWCQCCTANHTA